MNRADGPAPATTATPTRRRASTRANGERRAQVPSERGPVSVAGSGVYLWFLRALKRLGLLGPLRRPLAALYDLIQLIQQFWLTLALFAAVLGTGWAYEFKHGHQSLIESLYSVLQLLLFQQNTTKFPTDALGQALVILMPILGFAALGQGTINFGQRVMSKETRQDAWQEAFAATYVDHVIVCGLGRIGIRVVTRLHERGYGVVVIECKPDAKFISAALAMRVPVIVGDAREAGVLRRAGIFRARTVVADINNDALDIEIGLAARTARPGIRVIVRAFNEDLDRNLERIFGPDSAFSHSALSAPTITAAVISRGVRYALPVGDELVGVAQITAHKNGQLAGAIRAYEEYAGVRVVACHSGRRWHAPGPRMHFRPGMSLIAMGTLQALEAMRERSMPSSEPMPTRFPQPGRDTIIVCGLGKVGYRVVQRLATIQPRSRIVVVTYDTDELRFHERVSDIPDVTVIHGDATEPGVLQKAGIERAYALAAVTSDDLTNLRISLAARSLHPGLHVVLRVFNEAMADELNDVFGVRSTYSTSNLASPTLAAAAVVPDLPEGAVSYAFAAAGAIYCSDDFRARDHGALAGHTIEDIRDKHGLLVYALNRDGALQLFPPSETTVRPEDTGLLLASLRALDALA